MAPTATTTPPNSVPVFLVAAPLYGTTGEMGAPVPLAEPAPTPDPVATGAGDPVPVGKGATSLV